VKTTSGHFEAFLIGPGPDWTPAAGAHVLLYDKDGKLLYASSPKACKNFEAIAAAATALDKGVFKVTLPARP
jgi:hypothetical protein